MDESLQKQKKLIIFINRLNLLLFKISSELYMRSVIRIQHFIHSQRIFKKPEFQMDLCKKILNILKININNNYKYYNDKIKLRMKINKNNESIPSFIFL